MDSIYEKVITVTDNKPKNGDIRLSTLAMIFQNAGDEHLTEWHAGKNDFLARGLAWVVLFNRINVERMPRAGEEIRVTTWCDNPRHGLMARRFTVEEASGKMIATACSIWVIMDIATRNMITPGSENQALPFATTDLDREIPAPGRKVLIPDLKNRKTIFVSKDVIDEYGHMNNTNYFDFVDSLVDGPARSPRSVWIEYAKELRLGDSVSLEYDTVGENLFIVGKDPSETVHFKLKAEYAKCIV